MTFAERETFRVYGTGTERPCRFAMSKSFSPFGRSGATGLLVLEDGEAFGGRQVLPPGWRDLAGQPDSAATGFGRPMPGSPAGYGYRWWAVPPAPGG